MGIPLADYECRARARDYAASNNIGGLDLWRVYRVQRTVGGRASQGLDLQTGDTRSLGSPDTVVWIIPRRRLADPDGFEAAVKAESPTTTDAIKAVARRFATPEALGVVR